MSEVILYVNAYSQGFTPLDLFENESLPYTERFSDIAEFKSLGSFTKSFRIPATPNNDAVFKGWFNPNAEGGAFYQKVPARIEIDTIPYRSGHIQLNQAILNGEVIHEYEITFFAEAPDLIRSIGDKKVSEIGNLPNLNHDVTYANVTTGSAGEWDYALCDRGQKFSEEGEQGTRPVYNPNWPLYAGDLTPLVNCKWLVDNIVTDAGFTWEGWDGSTAFEDSISDIWAPWLNSRYIKYATAEDSYFFGMNNGADETGIVSASIADIKLLSAELATYNEVYDNGNNVAAGVFTAPFTGYYTFKLWVTIKITAGFTNGDYIKLLLQEGGNAFAAGTIRESSPKFITQNNVWKNFNYTATDVFLNQGDTIEMALAGTPFTYSLQGGTYGPNSEQIHTGFRLLSVSQPLAGEEIDMPLNAPDVKQIDLLRDLLRMHNVAVIPDRFDQKKIYLEPMVTYLGTGNTLDWTGKLDKDKSVVLSPTTALKNKVMKFTYKAGADAASQLFVKQAGRVYGDYLVEGYDPGGQAPDEFATGDRSIELTASSTPCVEINGTSIVTAKFMNDGGEFQVPGLHFVYIAGTAAQVAFVDDDIPGTPPVPVGVLADINVVNHYSSTQPDVDDFDLNWAPETPLHPVPVNPYNNLFNRWYRDFINDVYDFRARQMEAYFMLNLNDVLNFTFADRIWIKDSYWRVLEISDYMTGQNIPTKVTLLKIVNPDADCGFIPVSVSPGGVVTFEDQDGVSGFGSETCCVRYGYAWDDVAGKCFAFRGKKPPIDAYQSGLTGWGVAGQGNGGPNSQTPGGVIVGTGLEMSPGVGYTVVAGQGVTLKSGNFNVIAVGDRLILNEDTRGAALFGKNIEANQPGFHLGGGWEGDDRTLTLGRAQHGIIMYSGQGNYAATTDEIDLTIEGISGYHLEMDDNATWMCTANVAVHQYDAGSGDTIAFHYGVFTFLIAYKAGAASAGTVNTVIQNGSFGTLDLVIDTATDTDQHRFSVSSTSAPFYPYNVIKVTMALNYTQVRT